MAQTEKSALEHLLSINEIYLEPEVYGYERGKQILQKFPAAKLVEVPSHWNIPNLFGNEGSIEDWLKIKKNILVLGVKKGLTCRPNERSSNFVAPSISNGCAMACSYCLSLEGKVLLTRFPYLSILKRLPIILKNMF